jgi:hypothetical protein
LNPLPAEPFSGRGIINPTFSFMTLALRKAAFSAKKVNMVYHGGEQLHSPVSCLILAAKTSSFDFAPIEGRQ